MTQHDQERKTPVSAEDKRRNFESLSVDEMAAWLQNALAAYAINNNDRWAFRPFELIIGQGDDLAEDLYHIYRSLTPNGQTHFRAAVCKILETLPMSANLNETWQTLIDFLYHLRFAEVLPILERRFSTQALDALFAEDTDSYDRILCLIVGGAPLHKEAIPLIHKLVDYRLFKAAYAPSVLMQLCQIDPDEWTAHFTKMRTHMWLWKKFVNEPETVERLREMTGSIFNIEERLRKIAEDVQTVIGPERLAMGRPHLHIVAGPTSEPADNWFLDHLEK